nr:MAG TPA: hypothetical protein [Caudoviricetes sp.]
MPNHNRRPREQNHRLHGYRYRTQDLQRTVFQPLQGKRQMLNLESESGEHRQWQRVSDCRESHPLDYSPLDPC